MRIRSLVIAAFLTCSFGTVARACSSHGSIAGSDINNLVTSVSATSVHSTLRIGSSLVAPASTTVCAAGVGLGTVASPLPSGVNVIGLDIVVVHTDGSSTSLGAFSFVHNSATTSALVAGAGSSRPSGTNPLFAGATWFGFSSVVNPFTLPSFGPGEYTAMEFAVEMDRALLPLLLDAQFAGGEALADGTPVFSGDHPAQYFTAADPSVRLAPEPSSLLLALGLCALCVSGRRDYRR